MKTFIDWAKEEKKIDEGFFQNLALAGGLTAGMMGVGGQMAQAARPELPVDAKYYDQSKVVSLEKQKDGSVKVTIQMPFISFRHKTNPDWHIKIAREKALEAAAKNQGVGENKMAAKSADKPIVDQKGKTYTQTFYIIGR